MRAREPSSISNGSNEKRRQWNRLRRLLEQLGFRYFSLKAFDMVSLYWRSRCSLGRVPIGFFRIALHSYGCCHLIDSLGTDYPLVSGIPARRPLRGVTFGRAYATSRLLVAGHLYPGEIIFVRPAFGVV